MIEAEREQITGINTGLVVTAISIASFMIPIDITVANVAIPYITGDYGAEASQGKSIVTAYFIGEAIGIPMTGWLTKKYGDIHLFLFSLLLFICFSLFCAHSVTLSMLIVSRFFQGLASGPLLPLVQVIGFRCVSKEKVMVVFTIASMCFISGTMFGPMVGGFITSYWGWPWIFNINVPIGLFVFFVIWKQLWKSNQKERDLEPFDFVGMILVAICVISLQIFLDHGHELDWLNSPALRLFLVITVVSGLIAIFYELYRPNPFIDFRYFKKVTFSLSSFLICCAVAIDLSCFIIFSLWLQTYKNYTANWAGLASAPFGVGAIVFAGLSPILMRRYGALGASAFGCIIGSASCFYQAYDQTPDIDFYHLLIPRFFLGGAIILLFISLSLLCKQEVEKKDLTGALSVFQFFRSFLAAVGTTVFITMWLRRTILYRNDLIEYTQSLDPNTNNYLTLLENHGLTHTQALEKLNNVVDLQAATISFNNYLYAMGWVFLFMLFLCILGYKKSKVGDTMEMGFE